jgi:hypothetical protein
MGRFWRTFRISFGSTRLGDASKKDTIDLAVSDGKQGGSAMKVLDIYASVREHNAPDRANVHQACFTS